MDFNEKLKVLVKDHEALLRRKNRAVYVNGVYERYEFPVLTGAHAPIYWRYDLDEKTNPYLEERFGIHAAFNSGAIKWGDRYLLCVRVEGADRKSFFAMAESPNGVDGFRFDVFNMFTAGWRSLPRKPRVRTRPGRGAG